MSASTKIAVAVASGYLLGRTRKLKLAITVGGLLAGQRIATNPQALLTQGSKLVEKNPELQKLQGQITGKLMEAAKAAAIATATHQIENLHRSLEAGSGSDDEPVDEEPVDEEPADEEPADEEPADEEPRAKKASSTGRGTKKTAAKKAPAKRTAAKKTSSTKRTGARGGRASGASKRSNSSSRSSRSSSRS